MCVLCPVIPVSLDFLFVINTTIFSSVYLKIKHGETTVVHSISLKFIVLVFHPQCDYWFTAEHVCGKISSIWSIYISELIRYSRTSDSYNDFLDRGLLLTRKLLNQGFLVVQLKSSLRKLYGCHMP